MKTYIYSSAWEPRAIFTQIHIDSWDTLSCYRLEVETKFNQSVKLFRASALTAGNVLHSLVTSQ